MLFDVNDFDETAVSSWEWDVKRLVTSMAILGHEFGMPDDAVRQTAVKAAAAYRARINELAQMSALERYYLKTTALEVLDLVSRLSKSASKLATETVSKASRNTSHRALRKPTTTTVGGHYRIVEQQDIAVRAPEVPNGVCLLSPLKSCDKATPACPADISPPTPPIWASYPKNAAQPGRYCRPAAHKSCLAAAAS